MFKCSTNIPIEIEYDAGVTDEVEIKSHICLNSIENIVDSKTLYCSIDNIIINYELNIKEMLISDTDTLVLYFEFPDGMNVNKNVVMEVDGNGSNFEIKQVANNIFDIGTVKSVYDSILQNTNKSEQIHILLTILYSYH